MVSGYSFPCLLPDVTVVAASPSLGSAWLVPLGMCAPSPFRLSFSSRHPPNTCLSY